jgi:hypothetical protein
MKIIIALLKLIIFTFIAIILLAPKAVIFIIESVITILSILCDTVKFLVDRIECEVKQTDNGKCISKNKREKA